MSGDLRPELSSVKCRGLTTEKDVPVINGGLLGMRPVCKLLHKFPISKLGCSCKDRCVVEHPLMKVICFHFVEDEEELLGCDTEFVQMFSRGILGAEGVAK